MSFINLERKPLGKVCKYCNKPGLKWIKSVDTRTGVELGEANGKPHRCNAKQKSDFNTQIAHFTNELVIWESDSEEVKKKKMEYQDKLRNKGKKYT